MLAERKENVLCKAHTAKLVQNNKVGIEHFAFNNAIINLHELLRQKNSKPTISLLYSDWLK